MNKHITYQQAKATLENLANKENKTVEEIREDIMNAMLVGLQDEDSQIQAIWREIPHEGELPTPEEVIIWIGNRILGQS